MKRWTPARQRRLMQFGCYAAALGFPGFLIATDRADAVSPAIVSLSGLLFICAGLLSAPSRSPRPPKDTDHERRPDADTDDNGYLIDPLVRKVRRVVREHVDWPEGDQRMATVW